MRAGCRIIQAWRSQCFDPKRLLIRVQPRLGSWKQDTDHQVLSWTAWMIQVCVCVCAFLSRHFNMMALNCLTKSDFPDFFPAQRSIHPLDE